MMRTVLQPSAMAFRNRGKGAPDRVKDDDAPDLSVPADAVPFQQVIATGMRSIRGDLPQDRIRAFANDYGLAWTRSTVAAIETGKRKISADELVLLPLILSRATGRPVQLADLFPEGPAVLITDDAALKPAVVRKVANGQVDDRAAGGWWYLDCFTPGSRRTRALATDRIALLESEREQETRAARQLGIEPIALVKTAHALWKRGLVEERDRRAAEAHPDAEGKSLDIIRGHVTRQLFDELREVQLVREQREAQPLQEMHEEITKDTDGTR